MIHVRGPGSLTLSLLKVLVRPEHCDGVVVEGDDPLAGVALRSAVRYFVAELDGVPPDLAQAFLEIDVVPSTGRRSRRDADPRYTARWYSA
jgi:hypothetical protein